MLNRIISYSKLYFVNISCVFLGLKYLTKYINYFIIITFLRMLIDLNSCKKKKN